MDEDNNNVMSLDLNLGPAESSSDDDHDLVPNLVMSMEDWLDNDPIELTQQRNRRSFWRNELQAGEGSVLPAERDKTNENCTSYAEYKDSGAKKDSVKSSGDEGSFFDCNICLDLAKDPVVTCCGHLFCWPCLYRWLHHHSDAKECPICKGEVTMRDLTPIYGRGGNKLEADIDSSLKIPHRPQASRIKGWRQSVARSAFTVPMEEMIRRLEHTYDLNRQITAEIHGRGTDEHGELQDRAAAYQGRGVNREQPENHRAQRSMWIHRPHPRRAASLSSRALIDAVDSDHNRDLAERNQDPDRNSVSSIAAVIHSESQTVDNAVEIDSTVARSTSSSRRRVDASRVSDVDSEDSRPARRRRLR